MRVLKSSSENGVLKKKTKPKQQQLCRQLSAAETSFHIGNAEKHLNNRVTVTRTCGCEGLTAACCPPQQSCFFLGKQPSWIPATPGQDMAVWRGCARCFVEGRDASVRGARVGGRAVGRDAHLPARNLCWQVSEGELQQRKRYEAVLQKTSWKGNKGKVGIKRMVLHPEKLPSASGATS